jgi:rod shape-determining protein MreC
VLVNDPNAIVVGAEAQSGATGTIRGSIAGDLSMEYVDVATPLTVGQPVVTAGEALPGPTASAAASPEASSGTTGLTARSPYPPGLLIGTITAIKTDPNAVVQSATIKPAARLSNATFVLVILNYQGGFAEPGTSFQPVSPLPSASPSGSAKPTPTPRK